MHLERYYDGFSTERLTFRKLTLDDVEEWKSFYEDNPSIFYLNINTDLSPEAMAEEWIQIQLDRYAANQYGQLAIVLKETGKLLGTRGFRLMSIDGEEELFTMCSILKPYWRQGYGTEGAGKYLNNIVGIEQQYGLGGAEVVESGCGSVEARNMIERHVMREYAASRMVHARRD